MMPAARKDASRQIAGLDIIRFAAAVLVLLHHLAFAIWAGGHYAANYRYLGPYAWQGWIGVEIFFVLSGFIITYTAQNTTPATFVKNRAIRLYPAAWICSTITAAVLFFSQRELPPNPLPHAWANSALLSPLGGYVDSVYWTLPVEMVFYSIIVLVMAAGARRHVTFWVGALGALSTCSWLYASFWTAPLVKPAALRGRVLFSLLHGHVLHGLVLDYGCFFAIGALLWLCLFDRPSRLRLAALLFCTIGALLEIRAHAAQLASHFHATYAWTPPLLIWLFSVAAIPFAVRYNDAWTRQLGPRRLRSVRLLGLITYPLYLLHQSIGFVAIAMLNTFLPDIVSLALVMLVLVGLSVVVHLYCEKPLQTMLRKMLHKPAMSRLPAAATLP